MRFLKFGFLLFYFFSVSLSGQNINADSLFLEVKKMAEEKHYSKAIETILILEKKVPQDKTYGLYLVSLYNWNNESEKALIQLNNVTQKKPITEEHFDLYIRTYKYLKNWNKVIEYCDNALTLNNIEKDHFKIAKAEALIALNSNESARLTLNEVTNESKFIKEADYLLTTLNQNNKNSIALGYLITTTNEPNSQNNHFFNLDYLRKWKKNSIITRISYGDAFSKKGFAAEIDFYKGLKTSYWYFNAGLSEGNFVYSKYKFGTEWFKESNKWSFSVGGKYLNFAEVNDVWIATAHFGLKFNKEFLAGYRPYFTFLQSNTAVTHTLFLKKSFEAKESYLQLDLQYGTLPYYFLSNELVSQLKSYRVGVHSKFKLDQNWFVQPILLYENQEFVPKNYRNVFNFQLIMSYRF